MRRLSSRCTGPFRIFHAYFSALFGRWETRDRSRHYLQARWCNQASGATPRICPRRRRRWRLSWRPMCRPSAVRFPWICSCTIFWYAEAVLLEHNRPPQRMKKPRFRAVPLAVAALVFIDTMPSIECSRFSTPQWLRTIFVASLWGEGVAGQVIAGSRTGLVSSCRVAVTLAAAGKSGQR